MSLSLPEWLGLRESADADARAGELLDPLRRLLRTPLVIHDLGCGSGSMGRWLAPRLPGPQHWVLYDRDPELLDLATKRATDTVDAAGAPVILETRQRDLATLTAADLGGASLVTASALLDVLDHDTVEQVAAACVGAGCPALLTLSVVGQVELTPADPADAEIGAAFNAHQRRTDHRQRLGPDGVEAAAAAFTRLGAQVQVHPSPWRLGPEQRALTAEWLRGWVGAACEQRPGFAERGRAYLDRRLQAAAAGELRVEVRHTDLLAHPAMNPPLNHPVPAAVSRT